MGRDDLDVMVVGAGVSGYVAPVFDMPSFLGYLRCRAETAGAGIEIRRIRSLDGVLPNTWVLIILVDYFALTRATNGRHDIPAAEPVGATGRVS
jgi:hypothetical protein